MSNIDDVKNLYEDIAAEAFKMPEKVDPSDIRKSQRAKKVRNLATDGATEGERTAAAGKTKGPNLMGEGKYSQSETYVKGSAPVRASYGGKPESFTKEKYVKKSAKNRPADSIEVDEGYEDTKRSEVIKSLSRKKSKFVKKYGKDAPDVMYAVASKTAKRKGDTSKSDDRYAYESFLGEKKDETNIGGGNLKKLAKKATKRVDSNADGTVNSSDMKDSDVGEFVPGPTGGKVKTTAKFESWRSDMPSLVEKTMTEKDKEKEDRMKDKYDDSDMKDNMIKQYGKEEGEKIYYAKIRKMAMEAKENAIQKRARKNKEAMDTGFMKLSDEESKKETERLGKYGGPKFAVDESYLALYEDVIAALLESEYAITAESADILVDSMTDEALTVITEQYLEEKARGTRKKSTAHIYDMDETLYGHDHSKVRVHVNDKSGKRVQSLSNQQFNTHKLDKDKGHKYDFSEFGSSKTFQKSAKPLKKMIKHMKRQKARGYDTHIVTARADFDDKKHLAKQLNKHGVNITPKKDGSHTHLHRSGNEEGSDVGKKKQRVLSRLSKRHGYKKIHMYDDAEKVHKSTHGKTPGVKVKGHMVKPNKSGEVTSRPYKPTEPKGGKNNNK